MATNNTGAAESSKKSKPKGAGQQLCYDVLLNDNVKAEDGWENVDTQYWSSKLCKKYVKMYHIGKLWPKESHAIHTKEYCFKPGNCLNDHFVHRSTEVWRALFGEKGMSKGKINYSLACMVYVELVLARKVDWSTYPTTSTAPLQLPFYEKNIPDTFVSNVKLPGPCGTAEDVAEEVPIGVQKIKQNEEGTTGKDEEQLVQSLGKKAKSNNLAEGKDLALQNKVEGMKGIEGEKSTQGESSQSVAKHSTSSDVCGDGGLIVTPKPSTNHVADVSNTMQADFVFKAPPLQNKEHSKALFDKPEEEVPV